MVEAIVTGGVQLILEQSVRKAIRIMMRGMRDLKMEDGGQVILGPIKTIVRKAIRILMVGVRDLEGGATVLRAQAIREVVMMPGVQPITEDGEKLMLDPTKAGVQPLIPAMRTLRVSPLLQISGVGEA